MSRPYGKSIHTALAFIFANSGARIVQPTPKTFDGVWIDELSSEGFARKGKGEKARRRSEWRNSQKKA